MVLSTFHVRLFHPLLLAGLSRRSMASPELPAGTPTVFQFFLQRGVLPLTVDQASNILVPPSKEE